MSRNSLFEKSFEMFMGSFPQFSDDAHSETTNLFNYEFIKKHLTNAGNIHEYKLILSLNHYDSFDNINWNELKQLSFPDDDNFHNLAPNKKIKTYFMHLFKIFYGPYQSNYSKVDVIRNRIMYDGDGLYNEVFVTNLNTEEFTSVQQGIFENETTLTFYISVNYINGSTCPFPTVFSKDTEIKVLKSNLNEVKRKYRRLQREVEGIETSYARRVRRLNKGIKDKEEKYNRDMEKMKIRNTEDNKQLTSKIIEMYDHIDNKYQCPICYDDIKEACDLFIPGCCHFLCNTCADGCIKSNGLCPLCREIIYKPVNNTENHNNKNDYGNSVPIDAREITGNYTTLIDGIDSNINNMQAQINTPTNDIRNRSVFGNGFGDP